MTATETGCNPSTLEAFTQEYPHVPGEVIVELLEAFGGDASTDDVVFEGEADSYRDLAAQMVDDGLFGEIPEHLYSYIDCSAIGRDLDCGGMYEIRHHGIGYYWTML